MKVTGIFGLRRKLGANQNILIRCESSHFGDRYQLFEEIFQNQQKPPFPTLEPIE